MREAPSVYWRTHAYPEVHPSQLIGHNQNWKIKKLDFLTLASGGHSEVCILGGHFIWVLRVEFSQMQGWKNPLGFLKNPTQTDLTRVLLKNPGYLGFLIKPGFFT